MENGSILLAPQMRHILVSLDSLSSEADVIQKEAKNQVAYVGIWTQTSASSLDQLVCSGDLTSVLNPSAKQAHNFFFYSVS